MSEERRQSTYEAFSALYLNCEDEVLKKKVLECAIAMLERPGESEPLLNLKEVAQELGIHPATAWRWQLPWHEWRGLKRYLLSECKQYLDNPAFKKRRRQLAYLRDCQGSVGKARRPGRPGRKKRK